MKTRSGLRYPNVGPGWQRPIALLKYMLGDARRDPKRRVALAAPRPGDGQAIPERATPAQAGDDTGPGPAATRNSRNHALKGRNPRMARNRKTRAGRRKRQMRPKSIADIYVKMKRVKAVLRDLKERARRRDTRSKDHLRRRNPPALKRSAQRLASWAPRWYPKRSRCTVT